MYSQTCQIGEFMLYDFHQLKKEVAITRHFVVLQCTALKSWLNKFPFQYESMSSLFLFVAASAEDILLVFSES